MARELGYVRLITNILASEPGTSLKAAGWTYVGEAGGGSWSVPSRPREDKHPTEKKVRWEVGRPEVVIKGGGRHGPIPTLHTGSISHRMVLSPCSRG